MINNELNDQRVYATSTFEIISIEYKEVDGGIFSGLICYFDTICRHKQTHLINISIAIPQIIIQHLTGATSGAGNAYPSGAPEFDLMFLLVSVGNMLFMLSN